MNHICRHCQSPLSESVLDLGHQPPSNAYLSKNLLLSEETTYPLQLYVCTNCWLVQLPEHSSANQLFTPDYAYFSSISTSWCLHASRFVEKAVNRLGLDSSSMVIELASNDGYLLQYVRDRSIPCLGIEPTSATAQAARSAGIQTLEEFFGSELAETLPKADLVVANNVLAHVPDINDFMSGIAIILKKSGLASIEFPHLLELLSKNQFDTIYHEHYSYLSLNVVIRIASSVGLEVIDVEKLSTHGGSLRVWIAHQGQYTQTIAVNQFLSEEADFGLQSLSAYQRLQETAVAAKHQLLNFLLMCKEQDKSIIAYGAAAKGNTLLNYAGIQSDLLPLIVDQAPSKQGKYMPGSHIPIQSPEDLDTSSLDFLLLLPWNLIKEIQSQYPQCTLVTAIPSLTLHPALP